MKIVIELQIAKGQREGIENGAPQAKFWILILTLPLYTSPGFCLCVCVCVCVCGEVNKYLLHTAVSIK